MIAFGLALATSLSAVSFAPSAIAGPASPAAVVPAQYVITYQGNGGTGSAPPVQRVGNGDSTRIATNTFTRGSYTFTGWNTRGDGKGTAYSPRQLVTPTEDLALYARWAARLQVEVLTQAPSQPYRTSDPAQIAVVVYSIDGGNGGFPGDGDGIDLTGSVKIYSNGKLFRSGVSGPEGFAVFDLPGSLPLGSYKFTAEYTSKDAGAKTIKSTTATSFAVVKTSTITKVTLRQQALTAAEQKKYRVRSAVSVSVQVIGRGTSSPATGKVRIDLAGKILTLALVGGRAKTQLVPTKPGGKTVVVDYLPSQTWWLRSRNVSTITVR